MSWIKDLFQQLVDGLGYILTSILELVKDGFYFFFDLFMTVIDTIILSAIALFEPIDIGQYMSGFPPEAAWVLGQIGLPQALGMIVSSIGIRIILQLIPFTRLGS